MSTANEFPIDARTRRELQKLSSLTLRGIVSIIQETLIEWNKDRAQRLGASVAFYTLLSLSPLLVVLVALAAMVFGKEAAQGQLALEVQHLIGVEEAEALQTIIQRADKPAVGLVATLVSGITLMISASSVAAELQDALNTIWRVTGPPRTIFRSIISLVKERFYSLAIVLGGGLLLLISVGFSTWIVAIGTFFHSFLPYPEAVLHFAEFVVSFTVIALVLAAIYKILPDVPLAWTDVIVGAGVSSLLLTIGKQLIAFYLGKVSFGSTYGAAGSLVVVLVWVYYSAQLFFLGAEFTKVYTRRVGSQARRKIRPANSH